MEEARQFIYTETV